MDELVKPMNLEATIITLLNQSLTSKKYKKPLQNPKLTRNLVSSLAHIYFVGTFKVKKKHIIQTLPIV